MESFSVSTPESSHCYRQRRLALTQFAFFKGRIVPIADAQVSVMTHALNYGTGCFEGIRAYWNADEEQLLVFRMQEHYERFLDSMGILMMQRPYTADQLGEFTVELLRREAYRADAYIRPIAYKSDEIIGVRLHGLHDDVAIWTTPFGRYVENEEGAHVGFSSWRRVNDNSVPPRAKLTGAYINTAFIKTEAVLNGYDEALVLNQNGFVSEGSAENVFLVRDGVLTTPPVSEDILEGITRTTIIELARAELGLNIVERPISRTEFYVADEAFFTGTGVQIAAIVKVDHRPVGGGQMGPIVKAIRDLYFDVVRGKVRKYRHWCTPVYAEVREAATAR
jgi:branched-chain amino acid aminotransferase